MKANEAPEKIILSAERDTGILYDEWVVKDLTDNIKIEYTRTDAFIEKAEKWLSLNLKMLMNVLDVEYDTHETDIKDFVEDFKNYIKGE